MKSLDEIKFEEKKRQQAGMTVPEGFFEQFQMQLEEKIDALEAEKKQAPVIQMPARTQHSWINRWSVAACAAVLIGVVIFLTTNEVDPDDEIPLVAQGEKVDEQSEMEEMMLHSVNDYDLYEYYCEL